MMKKITYLLLVIAVLALIQAVFSNAGYFGSFGTELRAVDAESASPLLPKTSDKNRPGFPHVSYDDPAVAVQASESSREESTSATLAATADFDSDGVIDLVTTGGSGKVLFYKGNPDTIYPNSAEAKQRRAETGEASPFYSPSAIVQLSFSPDFLEAGDLNADGFADLLTTAKGSSDLMLLTGNGNGGFDSTKTFRVDGAITALTTGQIGRNDQLTDIAVAYQNGKGAFLAIFEHPEGAFARKPEIFPLAGTASSLAIGNVDKDPYGDVAVACGNMLELVHGRGQAYPLDLKADLDIQRPAAFVQKRQMPFAIADIAIGRFGDERGDSIALLSPEGRINLVEPVRTEVISNKLAQDVLTGASGISMLPAAVSNEHYGMIKNDPPNTEAESDARGQIGTDAITKDLDREKIFSDKVAAVQQEFSKKPVVEQNKEISNKVKETFETKARRKAAFEANLAAKPIPFSKFRMRTISADRAIASAISGGFSKMIKGRFSASGLDDIAMLDRANGRINIVGRWNTDGTQKVNSDASVVSLEAGKSLTAIVPMRLNADGMSDIVMMGAGSPLVMMSLPSFTLTVNSTDDTGADCVTPNSLCTLRRAIFVASHFNLGGTTLIAFDIPGSGVHTIHPTSSFEDITQTTTIDGTTQPGFVGSPLIEIEGDLMTGGQQGLQIRASNSLVRGLAINHFTSYVDKNGSQIGGSGITVLSTSQSPNVNNVIVEGNYLGTDPSGSVSKANDANGVHIYDADANTIGGTTSAARNILSGNGNYAAGKTGVGLAITGGNNNFIYGNYIGTNSLGNMKVGNSYGVFFTGINNQFGGDAFGQGNVVSGNGGPPNQYGRCNGGGIYMFGLISLDDGSLQTDSNILKGNKIGTNASGIGALGNCSVGVSSPADINTAIGSITQNGRNIISDNGWDALYCGYASQSTYGLSGACYIIGNTIGTDITGSVAMPNDQRNNSCIGFCIITDTVWVTPSELSFAIVGSPGGTTPGGSCTGMCNLISGNLNPNTFGGGGLYRSGYGFVFAVNNFIGVNRSGTAALPNFSGFQGYYGDFVFGAELSDGNGGTIDGGNVSSGNDQFGVSATAINSGGIFEIRGNLIGLSSDGISPIGNGVGGTGSAGIYARAQGGTSIAIGGTGDLQRNYVAAQTSDASTNGSRGDGLSINAANGSSINVFNNWIGLNKSGFPTGNSGNGISAGGDGKTRIGGLGYNEYNFIIGNGGAGVVVTQFTGFGGSVTPAKNVTIRRNPIAITGGLGIDLMNGALGQPTPSGVTPNDCFDEDDGANGFQNFPELYPSVINQNGTVSIPTTLRSRPARQYTIDYYQSPAADPTNYGEGSNYIGSITVQTDGNGFAGFTFTSPDPIIPTQTTFTATATDEFGNTSEFSCSAGVCNAGSFQQAVERAADFTCVQPITVNVDTDESDPNTADGVCDVDLSTPGSQCSLRAAIQESNARNGKDYVIFDIPGLSFHEITPVTPFPSITDPVNIDATTQHGYSVTPMIYVNGSMAPLGSTGFRLTSGRTSIRGFGIAGFTDGNGILIESAENSVEKCHIGVSPDGMSPSSNFLMSNGIYINNSQGNTIGSFYGRNLIASSKNANVLISGTGAKNNQIAVNNFDTGIDNQTFFLNLLATGVLVTNSASLNTIGTSDADANASSYFGGEQESIALRNGSRQNRVVRCIVYHSRIGISVVRSTDNIIGGVGLLDRNLIGDSGAAAIYISDDEPPPRPTGAGPDSVTPNAGESSRPGAVTGGNKVQGNLIGIGIDGTDLHNPQGIVVVNSDNNLIGGDNSSFRNYISRNVLNGIYLFGNNNTISKNFIGVMPNGQADAGNGVGLTIYGTDNQVTGNLISGNIDYGVVINQIINAPAPSNNTISGNGIGTDNTGSIAIPNGQVGVFINAGTGNHIGTSGGPNVISGNGYTLGNGNSAGVAIGPAATGNDISYNNIGTNILGTAALGNRGVGVVLSGAANEVTQNLISGNTYGIRVFNATNAKIKQNRIGTNKDVTSAIPNTIVGVLVVDSDTTSIGEVNNGLPEGGNTVSGNAGTGIGVTANSTHTTIAGNYVGVSTTGILIPNGGDGIKSNNQSDTLIIGNTIGGNQGNGILISNDGSQPRVERPSGGFFTKISGNKIGVTITNGITKIPNALAGIKILDVSGVLVGNDQPGAAKNIISGNSGPGVLIEGQNATSNAINDSVIGTDEQGTDDLGNGGDGVTVLNASVNDIGDNLANGRDLTIAGNQGNGVRLSGIGAQLNSVISSGIGVIKIGNAFKKVGNVLNGIMIENAPNNIVGGAVGSFGNKIAGNLKNGVFISGAQSIGNTVKRNLIGTDQVLLSPAFGNILNGVRITSGANNNTIGGNETDGGNTIGGNGGNGIQIDDETTGQRSEGTPHSINNLVRNNSIFMNTRGGIVFGINGFVYNDSQDPDEGPNRGQNYPQLSQFQIDQTGQACVQVFVDTDPSNANYGSNGLTVEFFLSNTFGQGLRSLGTGDTTWTAADYSNGVDKTICIGDAAVLGISASDILTSTATDADGNTSQFSPVASAPSPSPTATPTATPTVAPAISGTVTYGNAIDLPSVRFVPNTLISAAGSTVSLSTLTGANGDYSLSGFDTGSYTIMPSKSGGQNNAITSYDAALISQHVVGPPYPQLSNNQMIVADVSGNGQISSFDAAEVAHYVVSNSPVGATGNWIFNPISNFHSAITSSITGEDYTAFLMGEVSGNWTDSGSRPFNNSVQRVSVNAPELLIESGREVTIPIQVTGVANKGILSYEFDLRYDPLVIRPQVNSVDLMGTVSNKLAAVANIMTPGLLRIAVYGPTSLSKDGVLLNLKFIAVGPPSSVSPLTWERVLFNEGDPRVTASNGQIILSERSR